MATEIETGIDWGGAIGRFCSSIGIGILALEGLHALLDLLIAVRNQLLIVAVCRLGLFQCKDVFATVVADETLGDRFRRSFNPAVPQFGQFLRIVLTSSSSTTGTRGAVSTGGR
jgi:hypothetical protein